MISNVKFNELSNRVELLVEKVLYLEAQVKSLTDSQGGEIPPGMTPVATLAAEYGISTKKAEELAKNTGVMLVKMKSGGFVAPDEKFRRLPAWCCAVRNGNTDRRTGSIHCWVNSR